MIKTRKTKLAIVFMAVVLAFSLFFGLFIFREKSTHTANAEETVSVTQVQFRTSGETYYFFLRMDGQTDYATGNQIHYDTSFISNTNLLDNVTVYFLNGAASLREVWTGEYVYTYLWGDGDTIAFPMKSGYVSNMGVGARIESGAEIPMLGGTKKVTNVVRTFWQTYSDDDNAIGNYIDGYNVIDTSIAKVHLRGRLNIGLGDGNDWVNGVGREQILPTEVPATDGTTTYSASYWRKMLACNFLGILIHITHHVTLIEINSS